MQISGCVSIIDMSPTCKEERKIFICLSKCYPTLVLGS